MTVESHVVLSKEEFDDVGRIFDLLTKFVDKCARVGDPRESLREHAENCCKALDVFLCRYEDTTSE